MNDGTTLRFNTFPPWGGVSENCVKTILLATTVLAFSAANVMAAEPLASGRPAGVRQAQLSGGEGMLVVAGAAAIGFAVALATADSGPGVSNPTGSGSTSTSATGTP